jgi:hypothetical protein
MASSYFFWLMRALPLVFRPSALVLSSSDGPDGAGAELALAPAPAPALLFVLARTSRSERREAGLIEYCAASSAESASTPNADEMTSTGC